MYVYDCKLQVRVTKWSATFSCVFPRTEAVYDFLLVKFMFVKLAYISIHLFIINQISLIKRIFIARYDAAA